MKKKKIKSQTSLYENIIDYFMKKKKKKNEPSMDFYL